MNTSFREWIDRLYPSIDGAYPKGLGGFKVNAAKAETIIIELTQGLPAFVPDSTGLRKAKDSVRTRSFKLGSRKVAEAQNPESIAERAIFRFYLDEKNRALLQGDKSSAFLTAISAIQVPLKPDRKSRLGKIDLLGTTDERLPAVIELKCLGDTTSRSVGGLLGPIIQGLAYALTIRHYWAAPSCEYKREWLELEPSCALPETLKEWKTPIILAGDSNFWKAPSTWSKCPWSLFVELAEALAVADLPLFAAQFESWIKPELKFAPFTDLKVCDETKRLVWPTASTLAPETH